MLDGDLPQRLKAFHDRYGSVVRVGSDELSFIDPQAWKDIYSSRESLRPRQWGGRPPGVKAHTLISAPVEDHARFRKALGPAFSDRAVALQEPIVMCHVDLLVGALKRMVEAEEGKEEEESEGRSTGGTVVNLVEWINFTTFDIISELGWGSSFNCLREGKYHPWIVVVLHYKALLYAVALNFYPFLRDLAMYITPKSAMAGLNLVVSTSERNVKERLSRKASQPDFISYVLAHNETYPSAALSEQEIVANSTTLIVGGSDPVTTVLAGALNQLLQHPKAMDKLVREVRSSFRSESGISAMSTRALLPYLTAVLKESLRLCPPTPDSMRRAVRKGGANVAGHFLPEGTVVGVSCYAAFKSAENFSSPEEFVPERWLPHPDCGDAYSKDRPAAFHPFGVGPHNCIGQLLAWVELRVLLARLVWNFDIQIVRGTETRKWASQKIFWAWHKDETQVCISKATGHLGK
ncbi:hypothetical protein MMC14_008353 [Varicellaria rhodocarpa]|nr:hypothetical protein [Varicellaria rhodocarpa]